MFFYLRDGDREIDGMMEAVCRIGGETSCVGKVGWRWKSYPETEDRAALSMRFAKHQPRSKSTRRLKTRAYALQYNWFRHHFETHPDAVAVAWNGLTGTRRAWMAAAQDTGTPRIYMERAPLPGRVTVDHAGINQINALPRDISFYRAWAETEPDGRGDGWRRLKTMLTARPPKTRSDVGQGAAEDGLADTPFVFCPLQVPDDTQIKLFGGWVKDMRRFIDVLELAAGALPDGWHLRFKEHPSSKIPLEEALAQAVAAQPGKIVVDNGTDTFQQVAASRAVVTLNSSVGLQAFWFDRPVLVLGEAFFRMPELVTPVDSVTALFRSFADIAHLTYDAGARDVFMNYLDRVYYPEVTRDGPRIGVAPDLVRPKIAAALATRGS